MENSIFIARIFGLCYLVLGAGLILNRKAFRRIMDEFCKSSALIFIGGMFALVIGVVIVLTHNVWVANWTVLITILGWGALIKGVWMLAFPDTVPEFIEAYRKKKNLAAIHSTAALVMGAVLTYLGFFAR